MARYDRRAGKQGRARPAAWRGQSLVELALVLPLFALILIGTVDLGRAFFYYNRLTDAVEQGALYGIHYPAQVTSANSSDPNNIVWIVTHESASSAGTIDTDLGNVTATCYVGRTTTLRGTGDCAAVDSTSGAPLVQSGDTIAVRATYTFHPLTGQLIGILGSGFNMSRSIRMVVL